MKRPSSTETAEFPESESEWIPADPVSVDCHAATAVSAAPVLMDELVRCSRGLIRWTDGGIRREKGILV